MFIIKNLSFILEQKPLLQNINLEFAPGKLYGLIGHNGSGKSTLLKLLARQETRYQGSISFGQQDIHSYASKEFARNVAYLPQDLPTDTFLPVRELVAMGRFPYQSIYSFGKSAQDQEIIQQCLTWTHMLEHADTYVDLLSGGQRSRAWLAMMLAQKSQFLLLDEPLAALDISHQVEIMQLLQQLCHEYGLGIILVIHDINLAARYCDELIALKQGQVIYQGNASNLMQQEMLKQIYGIDLQITDHPHANCKVAFY
ncbi:ABC transporter ATP-binding protein [Psittacicella hinzii]|uniref:Iron-hydroxamate transporter ATP-binding subunit n=1 Tax=Psittacicella hinzii TaxID=2028575 RepID=A0A3A1YI67_9GAMM|nr:ABC transporter ATP-binding protein [Psittacicella hinzii]RIY37953.1 iron-hydroxamate transporter ATP-binding subunit [Psittacicella hinzii]